MSGWTTADLKDRFQDYLGRGVGGVMAEDELWTAARIYRTLADAQEAVYHDLAPIAPHAFVGAPVLLTSSDGGRTYTFGADVYPFGHVEVYAQEAGSRPLYATSYDDAGGDFVIEGGTIRAPGNRVRTYASGPYARFTQFPARISASQEPTLSPPPARELILWKALELANDLPHGQMDPAPWRERYAEARARWVRSWQTQFNHMGTPAGGMPTAAWWELLDAANGGF